MEILEKNLLEFSKGNVILKDVLGESLRDNWDSYTQETKVGIITSILNKNIAIDPNYELWIPFSYFALGEERKIDRFLLSSLGNVYSLKSKRFIKVNKPEGRYAVLGTGKWTVSMHRTMAMHFVEKPKELMGYTYEALQVNHINFNRHNFSMYNLEWCLPADNVKHAYDNGVLTRGKLDPRTKPILVTIIADCELKGEQFAIYGTAELTRWGFNYANAQNYAKHGKAGVGCRFKYVSKGEAAEYPDHPPEGFDINKLKIPRGKRITNSWNLLKD